MRTEVRIIAGTLTVALLIATATLLIPVPETWDGTAAGFHVPLAMNSIIACLHTGAAVLFLSSLAAYKATLRRAYVAISMAIVVAALGTLQLPILNGFDLWDLAWVKDGGVGLPFLLSGLALYIGTRNLGRLVGVKSLLTKAGIVLPAVIVLSAATVFLPHVASATSEQAFDASNAILAWSALFEGAAALIMLRVLKRIGAHYVTAMAWLSATLLTAFIILTIAIVHTLFTSATQDAVNTTIDVLAILTGFMWLRAGYAFAATEDY